MQRITTPHKLETVDFYEINSPLLKLKKNITSQCGEDGIVEKIFDLIKPRRRYCVELGAWDGKYMSNCWNLVTNMRWGATFIEGNKSKFGDLLATHGNNPRVRCINKFVDFGGDNRLDNILCSVEAPIDFDLLSIDVDGVDYFIWESLQKFKPLLVIIEFNPTVANDVAFVQARDSSVNQGCSLMALVRLAREKGYELACCTDWNAFFVAEENFASLGIKGNHINNLYKPICDGRIFHGYDSHIHTIGMEKLLWSGTKLVNADLQVVPESLRRFGDSQR
jgi:hypothetical protein